MMKIALFGKHVSSDNMIYVEKVIQKLLHSGVEILVYEPFLQDINDFSAIGNELRSFRGHDEVVSGINFLMSIGGDGTLLDASTIVRDTGIPIMGINIGRLGFLSSISKDEILPAVENLINRDYKIEKRALLKLLSPADLFKPFHYALNDLTINRKDSTSLMVIHVWIDEIFLNSYWADGLIVATPTGSTAYSLSSGGPILSPGSENFVITPIAPHNLTVRPIVISDKSKIRIIVEGRDKQFLVSMDSRTAIIRSKFEMTMEKADFTINLLQMPEKSFYNTIRDKLKWGLDIRN